MYTTTLLLAIFGASNVLALPLDLQTESAGVDIHTVGKRDASGQTTPSDWAHGSDCTSDDLTGCVGGHGENADETPRGGWGPKAKRWITPPSTVPVAVGTACSLETCDMCPTFPGCETASSGDDDDSIGDTDDDHIPTKSKKQKRWITPPSTVSVGFGTACSLETCDMCPTFPGCETASAGDDDGSIGHAGNDTTPKHKEQKRWVDPPSSVPVGFGTACSLETCDMCPSFPGCGTGEMRAGHNPSDMPTHTAQPPAAVAVAKRDAQAEDPATTPVDLKKNWQQPPSRMVKREANISPIVENGGVGTLTGPECSVLTCDLCPDHPGCSEGGQTWDRENGGHPPQ